MFASITNVVSGNMIKMKYAQGKLVEVHTTYPLYINIMLMTT